MKENKEASEGIPYVLLNVSIRGERDIERSANTSNGPGRNVPMPRYCGGFPGSPVDVKSVLFPFAHEFTAEFFEMPNEIDPLHAARKAISSLDIFSLATSAASKRFPSSTISTASSRF